MSNPNFLTANASGIELMPGVNDEAIGYDVNRIVNALTGVNIVPITTGNLTVTGNETISGTLQVTGAVTFSSLVGPLTINPGGLTVSTGNITATLGSLLIPTGHIDIGGNVLDVSSNTERLNVTGWSGGVQIVNGPLTVSTGGLTVSAGGASISGGANQNLTLSEDHALRDAIRIQDLNASPFNTWVIGLGSGGNGNGLGFYDVTAGKQAIWIGSTSRSIVTTVPISIPPSVDGTVAATSYGSVPVKIAEASGTGSSGTITISSIPTNFRKLVLDVYCRTDNAVTENDLRIQINGDTTAVYNSLRTWTRQGTNMSTTEVLGNSFLLMGFVVGTTSVANFLSTYRIEFFFANDTTHDKNVRSDGIHNSGSTYATTSHLELNSVGTWHNATPAAITSISVITSAGNFTTATKLILWGIP